MNLHKIIIKRVIKIILGRDYYTRLDEVQNVRLFGLGYGAWTISPSKLDRNSKVLSFGVGEDISFDLELIREYNLTIYAFDPSPKSISWINNQALPTNFKFFPFGISNIDGDILMNPPKQKGHVSYKRAIDRADGAVLLPVLKISSIIKMLQIYKIDLIKMDIEGSEYDCIDEILNMGVLPSQILIEFHHRFFKNGGNKTKEMIKKIRLAGYKLIYVSSRGEEYTFIRH